MSGDTSDFQKLITGTYTAVSQSTDISSPNQSTEILQLSGTWVGTLIVEGSNDGTTYYPILTINTSNNLPVSSITANGLYISQTNGFSLLRVRSSAWTSGTATLKVYGSDSSSLNSNVDLLRGGTDGTVIGNTGDALKIAGSVTIASTDIAPSTINITARDTASTVTAGANNQSLITGSATANSTAAFSFTSEEAISLQITGTWTGTMQAEVSLDGGTTWFIRPLIQAGTTIVSGTFTGNLTALCNISGYTNFRIRSTAVMTGTATVKIIESINAGSIYIANPLGISDAGGDQIAITSNNDLQTVDIVNTSGQYRAQSITTSAAEALGAASILTSRKSLTVTPTNGTVYWGYSNAVTTASGTPIFKNQTNAWAIGANVHVYLICASGTVDCRISEGS